MIRELKVETEFQEIIEYIMNVYKQQVNFHEDLEYFLTTCVLRIVIKFLYCSTISIKIFNKSFYLLSMTIICDDNVNHQW